jgi:hypothetical protein
MNTHRDVLKHTSASPERMSEPRISRKRVGKINFIHHHKRLSMPASPREQFNNPTPQKGKDYLT